MTKQERFKIFITNLNNAPSVSTRDAALTLLKNIMNEVENKYSGVAIDDYSERMHVFSFSAGGWMNLDDDPCYWDDSISKKHRLKIYNSGRIVILQIKSQEVLLDKK